MNVLAHRNISQLDVRGTVEVNDRPVGIDITSMSAYIQQEDIFVGTLTVREHLIFQVDIFPVFSVSIGPLFDFAVLDVEEIKAFTQKTIRKHLRL